ncbi:MAG: hypothetical protein M4579_000197 [Chaenotheca gracillima]|nr:MAG: hypothetical protein M4579_000197 [Chaenotheca gracillima]
MSLSKLQHRRTHNLLLISRLLNLRERISPFTLILDSLEQSARPLLAEFVRRANASKTKAVFVSFETIKAPQGVDVFLSARGKPVARIQKEISALIDPRSSTKTLLIIDTLYPLVASSSSELPAILSSFLSPSTSLLAVYHTDVPIYSSSSSQVSPYSPQPLALLKYLCTALLVTHSFNHVLARKTARDRSLEEPVFGLAEGKEGAVVGLGSNDPRGVVLEMEYRRKSGRGVKEWYFLPARKRQGTSSTVSETASATAREKEMVILLEDHPLYRASEKVEGEGRGDAADVTQDFVESTFNLGLTEKQRKDREGVVLPYFDAQNEEGEVGEGGRILYEMGEEDDFDEEEDEI